jgi:uncharacterized protein YacL
MQLSLAFIRILFLGLCILLGATLATADAPAEDLLIRFGIGLLAGTVFGGAIISLDIIFKRFNLRTFNTAIIGLFIGYLMGTAILLVLHAILSINATQIESPTFLAVQAAIFLSTCYLGMVMTARASNELYLCIPFVRFKTSSKAKKDILADISALTDPRTIDLAASGLLDQILVVPRFLLKELHELADSLDESLRQRGKRGLEIYKKLEAIPTLELRCLENNFTELEDTGAKLVRLARQLDAAILTADTARTQQVAEGIRYININALSNSLKPLAYNGESLNIKIQRYGKEPRQGVGYLDDGTMVVVNGGADYIGATIRAQVLSVKHTTSGRMIFCNAADTEYGNETSIAAPLAETATNSPSNYFAV